MMVSIRPLDSRLAPALCDEPPQALPANTTRTLGAVSVGVRCNGTKPWTVYVRGTVNAYTDIPVLIQSVPRGEIVRRRTSQSKKWRFAAILITSSSMR